MFSLVPAVRIGTRIIPGSLLEAGEKFAFMCEVFIDSDFNTNITYAIIYNSMTTIIPSPFMKFQPLTLRHVGEYQCFINISSPYITNNIEIRTPAVERIIRLTSETFLCCVLYIHDCTYQRVQ